MSPEQFIKIQLAIKDQTLRKIFDLFYDHALADNDTVARLEEKIKTMTTRLGSNKELSLDETTLIESTLQLLRGILDGDKPRD